MNVVDANFLRLLADEDKLLAIGIGQRAKQDGVNDAKDCRIGPDAEREREDGESRETRILAHHAKSVRGVLFQDFPVFARRSAEDSDDRFSPQF